MPMLLALLGWMWANRRLVGPALAGAGLIVGGFWLVERIGDAREREVREAIRHVDDQAVDATRAARDRVRACYARDGMRWDTKTGQCIRRLPDHP